MVAAFNGTTIQGLFSDRANPIAGLAVGEQLDTAIDFADHARISHKLNLIRTNAEMMGVVGGSVTSVNNMNAVIRFNELNEEKVKKEKDQMNSIVLEQMRAQMLSDIGGAIDKLRTQIEQDQEELQTLQVKADKLGELRDILLAGDFDPNNPDHRALFEGTHVLEIAGVDSIEEFAELDPEDQIGAVEQDLGETNDAIADLIQRIEANLEKLEILSQAKEDLENGVNPIDVRNRLEAAGIDLETINNSELSNADLVDISSSVRMDLENVDFDIEDLNPTEQAEFIRQARISHDISPGDLEFYETIISDEAKQLLVNDIPVTPMAGPSSP